SAQRAAAGLLRRPDADTDRRPYRAAARHHQEPHPPRPPPPAPPAGTGLTGLRRAAVRTGGPPGNVAAVLRRVNGRPDTSAMSTQLTPTRLPDRTYRTFFMDSTHWERYEPRPGDI